jgi:ABC-type antimicrobial peptide transport system permease subunit
VAVVSDVRQVLTSPAAPEIYVPLGDAAPEAVSIVARTAGDPMTVAAGLGPAVRDIDADVPVTDVWSMAMIVDSYFPRPFVAVFLLLSFIALLLSALGLYAVIAFQVTRRARELGIRMALGADPRRLLRLIMWEGLRLTTVGLAVGGVTGLGLGRVLASRFAEVTVADPALAVAVATVLAAVSVAACLLPARRATRVAPAIALRRE